MSTSVDKRLDSMLKAVLRDGADFADLYFEVSASHSCCFENGALEEVSSSSSEGVGARILKGETTSLSYAPGADLASGLSCLRTAAEDGGLKAALGDPSYVRVMETGASFPSPDHSFFHKINDSLRQRSDRIRQVSISLNTALKRFKVFNSYGTATGDTRSYTYFSVEVTVEKDGAIQTGYESEALPSDSPAFFCAVSPLRIAETALSRALMMLEAPLCPAGAMPVLLSGEAGGTMIHEACGHGFEADIVQKDFSVYRDKIGKQVASHLVTLVDDGTMPGRLGSGACDDEGVPCGRTVLIENGVARAYMSDIASARRGSLPLTGNGRRSSYRSAPQPRMTNTYVMPGNSSAEEMMRFPGRGLLVKRMGGGEVDPTSGDFVFHVTEGYLLEDGRVLHPVRGAVIAGNGPEALMDIKAVGDDLHFLPGICGKSGQSVPVTDGQPSLLVGCLTVGGELM
ncbi:MAG: TldD/PmbA family protein [Synergistota bacterium]|nr:TldD/PmbA family protein [Synergistota bacterium]